ncbi:hypothetical protein FJY94_01285 [Candidatus Kaiserbacteria bacterium]|nr:hypothetical protein [Candidatus Kaiserbacteria bacterium]
MSITSTSKIKQALGRAATTGGVAIVSAALFTAAVAAWTAPSANPPSGNMSPPITGGSVTQTKAGELTVNGLTVFGNTLIQASGPSNGYLSFGTTAGTSSYGIRSRNGLIEFKNQGGQWFSLATTTANYISSGQWSAGPSNSVYYTGGNVGINTSAPNAPLEVNGYIKMAGQSAEPQTCTAARKGAMAVTGSTATLCICNGTAWVTESNGGTCAWNVVPGSQNYTTSGTYSFTVPAYNTFTVQVWGAGEGGGGTAGGNSMFGTIVANGGSGTYGGTASGGTTNVTGGNGGGDGTNCYWNGGNAPSGGVGGAPGGYPGADPGGGGGASSWYSSGYDDYGGSWSVWGCGTSGGAGGYATRTYSAGQLSVGSSISVTVGAAGIGQPYYDDSWNSGTIWYGGGDGSGGRVYIEWN